MKLYVTDNGTAVDLDHVLAVAEVFEEYNWDRIYGYVLTLAFNSSKRIGYMSMEEAKQCRDKFIKAWQESR